MARPNSRRPKELNDVAFRRLWQPSSHGLARCFFQTFSLGTNNSFGDSARALEICILHRFKGAVPDCRMLRCAAGVLSRSCATCLRSNLVGRVRPQSERSIITLTEQRLSGGDEDEKIKRRVLTAFSPGRSVEYPIPAPEIPLQDWCGADREALVYRSLEEMVPVGIEMLPGRVFNAVVRPDLVHRVVHWQLAKRRAGTACTKSRGEVAGSGRKIRPQKGTGRSRQGAITSPIFRGGGVVHGPKPRDYSYPLPHNICRNGLRSALTSKYENGQLWIIESGGLSAAKTKILLSAISAAGWRSALVLDYSPNETSGVNNSLRLASHNVQSVLTMKASGVNVYDLLSFDMVVLTKSALKHVCERFEKYKWLV
jgi:large subunit ribosomal protein L4